MSHEFGQLHVDDNRCHRGGTWGQENLKEALDCRSGQPRTFCKMDIVVDGMPIRGYIYIYICMYVCMVYESSAPPPLSRPPPPPPRGSGGPPGAGA